MMSVSLAIQVHMLGEQLTEFNELTLWATTRCSRLDLAQDGCARIPAGYSKYHRQAVWIERDIR